MISVPQLPDEKERIAALNSYAILDTPPEAEYDAITKLASAICQTPISLITLIDEKRQWFKSGHGTEATETPREHAFCSHAILQPHQALMIPNLQLDERFSSNPFVKDDPHVVFYAGVPLTDKDGFALGTLCVLDQEEKTLNEFQLNALNVLAGQVVTLLQIRKRNRTLQTMQKLLEERAEELQKMVDTLLATAPALGELTEGVSLLQATQGDNLSGDGKAQLSAYNQSLLHISAVFRRVKDLL